MKKTTRQVSQAGRRKQQDGRLTTAEISRLREQKRMHRHVVTAIVGLGLMAAGTAMYFSPHANASDELTIYEMDDSQITNDDLEFTDADYAFSEKLAEQAAQAPTPHPDYVSFTAEEAQARADKVSEADLPEDGTYDPSLLLIDMASDTTQDDANALVSETGCEIESMFAEADGRYGASFAVKVPSGMNVLDLYRKILSNPKVFSCGFNYYFDSASVKTDDEFVLNGATDWSDGNPNFDGNVSLNPLDDTSVFDDPDETYGDLNAGDEGGQFMLQAESLGAFDAVEDSPESVSRWEYQQLRYEDAWHVTKTNGRVTVAVLDTGVMTNHRDLQNLICDNPVKINDAGDATVLNDKSLMTDPSGHGTHVAGIIAAQANNKFGTSGLSYNARILPVQLTEKDNGAMTAAAVNGAFAHIAKGNNLTNAQKNNVRVVNVSLGRAARNKADAEQWLGDTVMSLSRLNDSGALVVVAAGNMTSEADKGPYLSLPSYQGDGTVKDTRGRTVTVPPNVLSVINLEQGANGPTDTPHRKSTSNYNTPGRRDCEISAPGTNIYSTYNTGDNKYAHMSGTSQAAPIVSATAALVFAANPDLTPAEVKQIICETATDLGPAGFDEEYGYGEVNPAAAAAKAAESCDIDDTMDIGRENSPALANLGIEINGQDFPAFSYDKICYDLEYNEMRTNLLDTQFHFYNIPTGLNVYRRVSDREYSEEKVNATNGVKYREVNQVVTFLFASKNAQLTDKNALHAIYAFYIRYNVVTGRLGAEEEGETYGDTENVQGEEDHVSPAIAGMMLLTGDGEDVILDFDSDLPWQTQYIKLDSQSKVDATPIVEGLPDGYVSSIVAQGEGSEQEIALSDDEAPFTAYAKTYDITISNYLESYDYTAMLYCESVAAPSNEDRPESSESAGIGSGSVTDGGDPAGISSYSDDPVSRSDEAGFDPSSENPISDFKELKGMKCSINNKPYNEFQYEKTSYIINFKVGSTLPAQPSLTNIPTGWSLSSASQSDIPKSPNFPYGGKRYSMAVSKGTLRRQYEFSYSFYSGGKSSGASVSSSTSNSGSNGNASQPTTPQGQATPVASKPSEVTTTYVEESGTSTSVVEVGGLNGETTPAVNAANNGASNSSAIVGEKSVSANNNGSRIADTSPLNNFVSGGTLTQTGDAVVIACGAVISLASLGGIVMARRRMRNMA